VEVRKRQEQGQVQVSLEGMTQPLVLRPPYGVHSESGLPQGDPARKGLPLDESIPGEKTYAKPVDDIREPENNDESIHKVDGPNDLTKDQNTTPQDERDHSKFKPRWEPGGKDVTPKTKYPYRDGYPNTHNASMGEYVAGMWLLRDLPDVQVDLGAPPRVAVTLSEVGRGLNREIETNSRKCTASLKRADVKNLRWILTVNCGNGAKVVRMKAERPSKGMVDLSKMNVFFACSCPAWRWQGPEYYAKRDGYLDGRPKGTATMPTVRDPNRVNRVCKHVASAMSLVRKWRIPVKQASDENGDE